MRRLAPWLFGATVLAVAASWQFSDREPWLGPVFLLLGLAIGSQAVDAIRTGELRGRFPNKWPVDAERSSEPILFWLGVAGYGIGGLTFSGMGVLMIVEWLRR